MRVSPKALLWCGLLLLGGLVVAEAVRAGDSEYQVTPGQRQLFLDDAGIASRDGVVRTVHQPARHPQNPLLSPDTAWERGCQVYGTAYFDAAEEKFRMWYLTGPKDRGLRPLKLGDYERAPHTTLAAYAESRDGVHWVKPKLGLFPYDGDSQNNLLGIGRFNCEGISVLHDPDDSDPSRRWKCVYWDHGSGGWEVVNGGPYCHPGPDDGWHVAFSSDGIRWQRYDGNPVIKKYCDTNQNVVYDRRLKRYVGFSRFGFGRRLARSESTDFLAWTEPQLVLECDEEDGPGTQIYGAGVDLYEGLYLAMIWIYREGGDGTIDTQLATSRDGIHWTRVGDRATWLELADEDSWEGGMVRSVERIICRGDQLFIYYCGVHGPHTGPNFRQVERRHPVQIGLLTQRRDGFVSLDAGRRPGTVTTQPFALNGGRLLVNVDATDGQLRVEQLDAAGKVFATSDPVTGDQLAAVVRWGNSQQIPSDGRISLRFRLQNAQLFSYWLDD